MHPYRFFFSSLFVTSVVCCVCSLYFCMYACLFDRIVFVRSSWFCICFLWGGGWLVDHLDGVTGYYETRNFLKIRNHHFSHSSPCMNTNSPLPYTHHQSACIHWLRLRDKTSRLRQAPDRSGRWVTDVGCLTHFVAWTFHASARGHAVKVKSNIFYPREFLVWTIFTSHLESHCTWRRCVRWRWGCEPTGTSWRRSVSAPAVVDEM